MHRAPNDSLWSIFHEIITRPQSPIHNWRGGSQVLIRDGSSSPQRVSQPIVVVPKGIYQTLQTGKAHLVGDTFRIP